MRRVAQIKLRVAHVRRNARRTFTHSPYILEMSSSKLHKLHKELIRAFTSHPSDLKTSGRLLAELKVRFIVTTCADLSPMTFSLC